MSFLAANNIYARLYLQWVPGIFDKIFTTITLITCYMVDVHTHLDTDGATEYEYIKEMLNEYLSILCDCICTFR